MHQLPKFTTSESRTTDDNTTENSDYDNLEEIDDIMGQVFGEVDEDGNHVGSEDEVNSEYRDVDGYDNSMDMDIWLNYNTL